MICASRAAISALLCESIASFSFCTDTSSSSIIWLNCASTICISVGVDGSILLRTDRLPFSASFIVRTRRLMELMRFFIITTINARRTAAVTPMTSSMILCCTFSCDISSCWLDTQTISPPNSSSWIAFTTAFLSLRNPRSFKNASYLLSLSSILSVQSIT